MNRREFLVSAIVAAGGLLAYGKTAFSGGAATPHHFPVTHTDAEWRKILTPAQYEILREKGTEPPGSGQYDQFWQRGTYVCAGCGNPLFSSATKYDPHEGWPSFWKPISDKAVITQPDYSLGMERMEVECARCGGHLGHVFDDGPQPTGLRYCMDSLALKFIPAPKKK
ncbi:MAG: peptide-methionine (R)-S-oxide reductase MsrB [Armatimonadetes bacterium]|nr:peptide-methionine (R)-S-oxide reductase MsrB [Armatimonadota bacterium]